MKTSVELFSGIGGFRVAADLLGIQTIWANDNCSMACQVYRQQFGSEELREGDIADKLEAIPSHDLLTAGFPCQPFSSAGKKQGIKDPRGTLFSHVVSVLARHRPQCFVLENVKRLLTMERGIHFATILAALAELDYLVEWRLVNALDFGLAQNRERVLIIGTRKEMTSDHNPQRLLPSRLAAPADFASLTRNQLDWMCSPQEWKDIGKHGVKFPYWGLAKDSRFFGENLTEFAEAQPRIMLRNILQRNVSSAFDFTQSTVERIGKSIERNKFVNGVQILSNQGGGARMGYTVFGTGGVAPTLTSTASRHYERYKVGKQYRRLTNVEYARLQGFSDEHCSAVSIYNQYALFGNAVPPPMVKWAIERLSAKGIPRESVPSRTAQKELFVNA